MIISDSQKTYKAPRAKVIEVNVQGVLCNSNEAMFEKNCSLYNQPDSGNRIRGIVSGRIARQCETG